MIMLDQIINLPQEVDSVPQKNSLDTYWPTRKKGNDFDWEETAGYVLGLLLHKQIDKDYDYENLISDCKNSFSEKLDDQGFWEIIEKMYFQGRTLNNVAPEFNLINAHLSKIERKNKRLGAIFENLICHGDLSVNPVEMESHLNFIEKDIYEVLGRKLIGEKPKCNEEVYLPFLADCFIKDVRFLEQHPTYFLAELVNCLKLYAFLYCSQLALNLKEWRQGEPTAKPLYFLLENEKASLERTWVRSNGFYSFDAATKWVFPILSMLENINKESKIKHPLWWYSEQFRNMSIDDRHVVAEKLQKFAEAFKEKRNLQTNLPNTQDPLEMLEALTTLAYEQFDDQLSFERIKRDYVDVNNLNRQAVIKEIGSDFVASRGRAGRILVINQDYLLLLTNLAIGENDRLRLHELLSAFQQRGVYFDKQSEIALVNFFERIGNVERLSDSGEAVYVYKTI